MKIYVLDLCHGTQMDYDTFDKFVVCADSEEEARTIASYEAWGTKDKNPIEGGRWLDPQKTTCEELKMERGIVVSSFNAG